MKIAVENSTWNNIGDAFYQTALQTVIGDTVSDAEVVSFDGPFARAYRPGPFRNNGYDSRFDIEADHYVFSGPILGAGFTDEYAPLIKSIVERNKKYSFFSVHAYAQGFELEEIRSFLSRYPPEILHTRDTYTYSKFSDQNFRVVDGICFAFFVSKIRGLPSLRRNRKYIVSSYHSSAEPMIEISDNTGPLAMRINLKERSSQYWRIRRHFEFLRKDREEVGGIDIIRSVHGLYPFAHLTFGRKNSYATFNPRNFLSLYSDCELVITDRVHAGVAGLSFGKPAIIKPLDTRFALLKRGPVQDENGVFTIDTDQLETEFQNAQVVVEEVFSA